MVVVGQQGPRAASSCGGQQQRERALLVRARRFRSCVCTGVVRGVGQGEAVKGVEASLEEEKRCSSDGIESQGSPLVVG